VRLLGPAVRPGWPIAVALGVTETVSCGTLNYAFSVLLAPMEAELGWSRAQLTAGFSLALLALLTAARFPTALGRPPVLAPATRPAELRAPGAG
jgi:hypothetical protein